MACCPSAAPAPAGRRARLGRRLAAWLALSLLGAVGVSAQIPRSTAGALAAKAFRHPTLYIAQLPERADRLDGIARAEAAQRLAALQASSEGALVDRRSGRWATLLLRQPLLPGRGVGNRLAWRDLPSAAGGTSDSLAAAAWQALEVYLLAHAGELRVDPSELALPARVAVHDDGDRIQIWVGRRIAGVPVRDSYLTAALSHGNLILLGFRNWGEVRVAAKPSVSAARAGKTLTEYLRPLQPDSYREKVELVILPTALGADPRRVAVGEGYRYRLAWVLSPAFAGELGRWEALIDAHSGELLSFDDTLRYASTRQVVGGVYPVSNDGAAPDGVEQPGYPMPYADVFASNKTLFTDAGGNYPMCVEGSITTTLDGRHIRIDDFCGPPSEASTGSIDLGGGTGADCEVPQPGISSPGNTHSSRTAFYELNRIAEQARAHLPGNLWLQRQLTAVVNIPDFGTPELNCNAFWDETTINFFTSGSAAPGIDCSNTGELAGVLDHEWGHGLDDNDVNPAISSPGEGIADVYAALRLNDSCIGRGFYRAQNMCGDSDPCLACDGVRDIDWAARQSNTPHDIAWIDQQCAPPLLGEIGPCGGGIHCEGAVYAEAIWDLVHRDLQSPPFDMDLNTALEVGTRLTYLGAGNVGSWYSCIDGSGTGDGCNADGGYLGFLAIDDDNGDLADGTPHMQAIFAAFDRHGIACPTPVMQNSGCSGAPVTPPVVTASAVDRGALLSWAAVPGAVAYQVFRTDGVFGCDFGKLRVGETTSTEFLDEGLLNGTEYYYTVIPVGAGASCTGPASACTPITPAGGASLGFDPSSVRLVTLNGDLDPFIDNCEQAELHFSVSNTGSGPLSGVELVDVEVLSHPGSVTITTPLPAPIASSLGVCAAGSGMFAFRAEGLAFNDTLEFRLEVAADELGGRTKSHLVRLLGGETSLEAHASKRFSFESDLGGWQRLAGTFGRSDVGGGADGTAFYLASSENLPEQCDVVRSPILRLSPSSTLAAWTQFDIEPPVDIEGSIFWFDRANIGLVNVASQQRLSIVPDGGRLYNASGLYGSCGTEDQQGWADSMPSWAPSTWSPFALLAESFAGQFVQLDVQYGTDVATEGWGFRLDEVTVTDVELVVDDPQTDTCVAGNSPPEATDDAVSLDRFAPRVIAVLDNDSDPDPGDSLRILGVTQPTSGRVTINAVGPDLDVVTYTPAAGPGGVDSFQYSAGDGRGGSSIATVTVSRPWIFADNFESGDGSSWSGGGGLCDPNGAYTLTSPSSIRYSCCFGAVDVDISQFLFVLDGAEITTAPSNPVAMQGAAAACPAGAFSNVGSISGGCTETYALTGAFTGPDTWSGTYSMTFVGPDCSCLDLDPCFDQVVPVSAQRP